VPAVEDGASRGAISQTTQTGVVAFTTTHWSVVLAAQGESPEADAALEKLCRTYWRPLYGFVRRQGRKPEEAQDLTQGFFALLLERRDLNAVRKEKGRLRSYLLSSLKHFLADEWRHAMAVKRGKGHCDYFFYNFAAVTPALPTADRQAFYGSFTRDLCDKYLTVFADFKYVRSFFDASLAAVPFTPDPFKKPGHWHRL
jgi:hypothetical protein